MTEDRALISRSLAEPVVFGRIFERHARVVGAFAVRRVGSEAGQDVLSETFLVAFRRRASFDPTFESARPWLLGIASRLIARHRSAEAAHWRMIARWESVAPSLVDDPSDRVDARADAETALRSLAPRIAALADGDRDTLLLHAWGDLTYAEMAAVLEIPVGTVRSRLNRVRRALREEEPDGRVPQSTRAGV